MTSSESQLLSSYPSGQLWQSCRLSSSQVGQVDSGGGVPVVVVGGSLVLGLGLPVENCGWSVSASGST